MVANATVAAGTPFNVTLSYVDDNETDPANLTWAASFSNGTSTTAYNGTGLPATFETNLTMLGNVTMEATASSANHSVAMEPLQLLVQAVETNVDPCADAGPQEAVTASGSTLLPGDVGVHAVEVGPCQTRIHVAINILVGGDMDFYLFDPSGSARDSSAAFGAEGVAPESDLDFQDPSGLKVGTWRVEIENFASLATDYEITVTFG